MSVSQIEKDKSAFVAMAGKAGSSLGSNVRVAGYQAQKSGSGTKQKQFNQMVDRLYEFFDNHKKKEEKEENEDGADDVEISNNITIDKKTLSQLGVIRNTVDGAYDRAYNIAINNVLQNSRDQIFYETANIITNTQGGRVPPSALLQNLILFIYGDKQGRLTQENINKTEKFEDIIFLAITTQKALLGNGMTEEDVFNQVSQSVGKNTSLFFNRFRTHKGCEKKTIPGKGLFSRSKITYSCKPEIWADIYSSFTEKELKSAISRIIFSTTS